MHWLRCGPGLAASHVLGNNMVKDIALLISPGGERAHKHKHTHTHTHTHTPNPSHPIFFFKEDLIFQQCYEL